MGQMVLLEAAALLVLAAGAAAAGDACSGIAVCASSAGACRAVPLRTNDSCGADSLSCATALCVLAKPVGNITAPAVIGVEGAVRAVTNSTEGAYTPVSKPLLARTYLAGCTPKGEGEPALDDDATESAGLALTYELECSGGTVSVTERWSAGADGSARWTTTLHSTSTTLFTTTLGHDYWLGYSATGPAPRAWFPGAAAFDYPTDSFSPFDPWSLSSGPKGGQSAQYGSEGGTSVTVLGMASLLFGNASSTGAEDTALSFVQDPRAYPYLATLGVCGKAAKGHKSGRCPPAAFPLPNDPRASHAFFADWMSSGYRLGGDTPPVVLSQDLLLTNSDWRAALGWAVAQLPEFFEPHVNMSAVDGPGTYAHIGHSVIDESGAQVAWDSGYNNSDGGYEGNPPLPAEYAELGNTLNWDASFPYQSHGNFIRTAHTHTQEAVGLCC